MVHSQNLFKNCWKFGSGFFRIFRIRFFPRKKRVGEVGGGQILAHLLGSIKMLSFMYKLELGHDGADVKNRENYIYVVVQYLPNTL